MMALKNGGRMLACLALLTGGATALPLASLASKATPGPKPPSASTGGTLGLSYSSATLTATVNPQGTPTSYYFQYGPTAAYGAQTPVSSAGASSISVRVSQSISGLTVGGEYHYRVLAVSAAGTTAGQDRVFTTRSVPLKFEVSNLPRLESFGSTLTIAGVLMGTGGAGHEVALQASPFPYLGTFGDIGSPQTTNADGRFSFQVPALAQSAHLRVVTLDPVPTYSAVMAVRVAVRVSLRARPTRRAGYVRLYGSVVPAVAGAQVAFQWLRVGRSPVFAGGATVKGAGTNESRFSSVVFIPYKRSGSYRAFVVLPDDRYASAYSRTVRLRGAPAPVRRRTRRRR